MPKLKKSIPAILSMTVLIVAVFLPTVLFRSYDNSLLGKVQTEAFTGLSNVKIADLDTQSRLELICGYGTNENIVVADKGGLETKGNEERLVNIVLEEIKAMQEIGAFPKIDLESGMKLVLAKTQTFTDISLDGKYVQINYLTFTCEKYNLQLIIDTKTNHIYQYELWLNDATSELDFSNLSSSFAKYLGIHLSKSSDTTNSQFLYTTEDKQIKYTIETDDNGIIIQLLFGRA